MEKDKLYKQATLAACNYATHDGDKPCIDMDFYGGFKQGAEWLMGQPIADRLADGEREKIIAMYNQAVGDTKGYYSDTWDAAYAVIEFCEQIFGKEMFEPKNNNI